MKNYSKIIANNITALRKEKGYTQETLAKKLDITFQAVSKWETEQSSPDILMLPQLAEIFGVSIDEIFGKAKSQEAHHNFVNTLPWLDDESLRGVVFLGHKILNSCDNMSKFTFKLEGHPLNVISHCNIECGDIQNDAQAACDINLKGSISGNANAGCDINCGGEINGNAIAGCDINCGGEISGDANAGTDINCGNIGGGASAGDDINVEDSISGDVSCGGDLTCKTIHGDVVYNGDLN